MAENRTNGSLALEEKQYKVITIEPAQKPQSIQLRVAAYARVSTASNDQMNSFAAQNAYYSDLISKHEHWRMVDIYADAGLSGVTAEKRTEFQRMLSDCRRGLIDRILVKSISRFARNTRDCLETVRELKSIGVSVYFEEQRIDTANMSGEFITSLFAAIAQKESESIGAHMRWSYRQRMQAGSYLPGSQPFGYRLKDGKIVIEPSEAELVRQIFNAYLQGQNITEIADIMRAVQDELPGENHRKWTFQLVLQLLRNEKYTGDSLWQKSYSSDTFPVVRYKNHGEREQYYAMQTHPPIISKDTFERAQALLMRRKPRREGYLAADNPFPNIMKCGCCGANLRRIEIRGVPCRQCLTHERDRALCTLKPVREEEIKKSFLRLYYKLRNQGMPALSRFLRNLLTVRERKMLWSADVIALNKRISELSSQNQMLAELKKCGSVDPDIFIYKSNELAEQLRAAKLQKERVLSAESDDTIPRTRELIETLEAGPERLTSFDAELFGELIDRIIVDGNELVRFRLKNGLELQEKLERTVR